MYLRTLSLQVLAACVCKLASEMPPVPPPRQLPSWNGADSILAGALLQSKLQVGPHFPGGKNNEFLAFKGMARDGRRVDQLVMEVLGKDLPAWLFDLLLACKRDLQQKSDNQCLLYQTHADHMHI
jgi:hypothetical protein